MTLLCSATHTTIYNEATRLSLRISCEKTKAMSVASEQSPSITIGQQTLEYVYNFSYLGSYISKTGDAEVDTRARLGKAASVFQRLPSNIEQQCHQHDHHITLVQIN